MPRNNVLRGFNLGGIMDNDMTLYLYDKVGKYIDYEFKQSDIKEQNEKYTYVHNMLVAMPKNFTILTEVSLNLDICKRAIIYVP